MPALRVVALIRSINYVRTVSISTFCESLPNDQNQCHGRFVESFGRLHLAQSLHDAGYVCAETLIDDGIGLVAFSPELKRYATLQMKAFTHGSYEVVSWQVCYLRFQALCSVASTIVPKLPRKAGISMCPPILFQSASVNTKATRTVANGSPSVSEIPLHLNSPKLRQPSCDGGSSAFARASRER
jgi:hypothetical protein